MFFKVLFFIFVILIAALNPLPILAQNPSCCSQNGGVYACNTSTSQLYCKDGTISRECTCKPATPTPTLSPSPTPAPTLPACVPNSSFDASSKNCRCNSGYTVKDNTCITYRDFCWATFGGNSNYDAGKNGCVCASGYGLNSDGKSCISLDEICRSAVGEKSSYNKENNSCVCFSGYSIQDNKCQPIPSPILSPIVKQINISKIPSPTPSIEPASKAIKTIVPDTSITPEKEPSLIVKNGGNFITEEKSQENIIMRIFSAVRNFFSRIFRT